MKKILAISIIAMTAVSAANAQIASKAYVDVASNGTYVSTTNTAGQNIKALDTQVKANTDKLSFGSDNASTTVAEAIAAAISGVTATAGSALQTVTENNNAGVVTNIAKDGTAVTMTKAKVTASDIADNAAIAATQLESGVQTTLTNAAADHIVLGNTSGLETTYGTGNDTIVEALAAVNSAATSGASDVKSVEVNGTALTPDANGAVNVTAAEGSTNGTIAVNGADVAVHGLGSAAYTPSTDYATAAQGALAASAVQSVAEGATNGTVAVDGTDVAVHGLGTAAYTASTAYATAAQGTKADSAIQTVTKTGTGNLLTGVSTSGDTVTITVNGTALVDPATSNENGVYVLTATTSDGTATYAWEQIARGASAQQGGGN